MKADIATIGELLKQVIGDECEGRSLTEQTAYINDLGLTSIQIVDLVMAIEDRFGIEVEDVDLGKLRTVGQTIAYIDEKTPA